MSIDHNRIKVADLETNEPDKILSTNSLGELEFMNVNNLKTENYNGLDCTEQGKALDARQGKVLKDLIDNKVDKVSGERLINTAEINKLSGLSNVVTTIKPILSTALSTQDVAGFVSYINSLNPILVVGSNEIVKFTTTDTGRVFQLNLRGRSFGTGQSPIIVSDVVEITAFLNKDLKLSNYPSTRNDGNLTTNKVFSSDANGNLKLYTITSYPAPYLTESAPDSFAPNSTGNLILKGAFFTPTMTVQIVGQTVNYLTFISDNEIRVNVTTGSTEGNFDVILNNGLSATFSGRMVVILGTVFKPTASAWTSVNANLNVDLGDEVNILNASTTEKVAKWNKTIDHTKNWRVTFSFKNSPLSSSFNLHHGYDHFSLRRITDDATFFKTSCDGLGTTSRSYRMSNFISGGSYSYNIGITNKLPEVIMMYEKIGATVKFYIDGVVVTSYNLTVIDDLYVRIGLQFFDIFNIKYIELV